MTVIYSCQMYLYKSCVAHLAKCTTLFAEFWWS